jgi:hypothetical protein
MKTLFKIFPALICILASTPAFSQDDKQAAEQKAWMDYMTPGNAHQMLAKSNGEWNEEMTMWMEPGAQPVKSTATAVNTMILGGRYQHSKHTGNVMGMPFEGVAITGFDNIKKVYVSTWIDNMGTGIMYSEGKWNEATKTVEFKGTGVDPMSGKELKIRQVMKIVDDNTETMEMFTTVDGKEFKSMEIKMTRKM